MNKKLIEEIQSLENQFVERFCEGPTDGELKSILKDLKQLKDQLTPLATHKGGGNNLHGSFFNNTA